MAPKGGGKGGGSSSSSGSDEGGSQSSLSVWTEKFEIYGSKFHDPIYRAIIIILAICFVAICGLAIWSFAVRKSNRPLRWAVFAFSILMAIM